MKKEDKKLEARKHALMKAPTMKASVIAKDRGGLIEGLKKAAELMSQMHDMGDKEDDEKKDKKKFAGCSLADALKKRK